MVGIVIGVGEIGRPLYEILAGTYPTHKYDTAIKLECAADDIEIMHICFPWGNAFNDAVLAYKEKYNPKYTVIHATVPVGTSDKLGAIHSPVRGMHPHLKAGLLTFTKFVGGAGADAVADYFRRAGIKVKLCRSAKTTELAKLMSTLYYGVCIEFAKEAERLCADSGVPFAEAFTLWQQTYNAGYTKLDRAENCRPVLEPIQQKIGGHCICPNATMLDTKFADIILGL